MPTCQIDGTIPVAPAESYIHPTVVLTGGVIPDKDVYVGPNASLCGDFGHIVVKDGADIQDSYVMHGFSGQDAVMKEDGHIGHGTILYGRIIGRNALAGMGAVIIGGVIIGENNIASASALARARAEMPANHLTIGSPAKVIRILTEQELVWKKQSTHEYQVLVERCQQTLAEVEPLAVVESDRKWLEFDENL